MEYIINILIISFQAKLLWLFTTTLQREIKEILLYWGFLETLEGTQGKVKILMFLAKN